MANISGPQPDVKYCSACKGQLQNVPRSEMISQGYKRKDGTVSPHRHTYKCLQCGTTFEINQNR